MKKLYFRFIRYRIEKMEIEKAAVYVAKSKLCKLQKIKLLMDKGLNMAESEAAILTAEYFLE